MTSYDAPTAAQVQFARTLLPHIIQAVGASDEAGKRGYRLGLDRAGNDGKPRSTAWRCVCESLALARAFENAAQPSTPLAGLPVPEGQIGGGW
jgi:hypothetical protein